MFLNDEEHTFKQRQNGTPPRTAQTLLILPEVASFRKDVLIWCKGIPYISAEAPQRNIIIYLKEGSTRWQKRIACPLVTNSICHVFIGVPVSIVVHDSPWFCFQQSRIIIVNPVIKLGKSRFVVHFLNTEVWWQHHIFKLCWRIFVCLKTWKISSSNILRQLCLFQIYLRELVATLVFKVIILQLFLGKEDMGWSREFISQIEYNVWDIPCIVRNAPFLSPKLKSTCISFKHWNFLLHSPSWWIGLPIPLQIRWEWFLLYFTTRLNEIMISEVKVWRLVVIWAGRTKEWPSTECGILHGSFELRLVLRENRFSFLLFLHILLMKPNKLRHAPEQDALLAYEVWVDNCLPAIPFCLT